MAGDLGKCGQGDDELRQQDKISAQIAGDGAGSGCFAHLRGKRGLLAQLYHCTQESSSQSGCAG